MAGVAWLEQAAATPSGSRGEGEKKRRPGGRGGVGDTLPIYCYCGEEKRQTGEGDRAGRGQAGKA